jgi:hypothetical protein
LIHLSFSSMNISLLMERNDVQDFLGQARPSCFKICPENCAAGHDLSPVAALARSVRASFRAAKIILQAHNIVFTKIGAALDLDEDEQLVAGVLYAMR